MSLLHDDPLAGLPDVLTLDQCADVLQVSPTTMRKLIADGVVPAFQLGSRLTRVYKVELLRVIEESRIGGDDGSDSEVGEGDSEADG